MEISVHSAGPAIATFNAFPLLLYLQMRIHLSTFTQWKKTKSSVGIALLVNETDDSG